MNLAKIQEWGADRGWCQYPLPRRRPARPRPDHVGLRLVAGALGLFGVIVIGSLLVAAIWAAAIFISA